MGTLHYSANNSGGSWWLTDRNWKDLAEAGWKVGWLDEGEHWSDNLATGASFECDDPQVGVLLWEQITSQLAGEIGCTCCGPPHNFSFEDDEGNYTYPDIRYETTFTW